MQRQRVEEQIHSTREEEEQLQSADAMVAAAKAEMEAMMATLRHQ